VPPVDFTTLVAWGESPPVVFPRNARALLSVLGGLNVVAAAAWLVFGLPSLPLAFTLLASGGVALWLRARCVRFSDRSSACAATSACWRGCSGGWSAAVRRPTPAATPERAAGRGHPPSEQLLDLASLVDWLHAARNGVFIPIALLLLWHSQMALSFEAWRRRSGHVLRHWLEAIGSIEAWHSPATPTKTPRTCSPRWSQPGCASPPRTGPSTAAARPLRRQRRGT
jgi:hypothetical protein